MSTVLPESVGRYRVEHELGRGAMGVVYRAYDPLLDRAVAIKAVLLTGDNDERISYEARFLQEAKAAGRLAHPAIITIHDVGREGDLMYMAMELLHGIDLRTRIARSIPPAAETLGLIIKVAEGLAFAHEHGVVHRDIKPGNVMIVRGEHAKIMDFGIARLQLSDIKTQTGVLLGTPRYMSPEQIAGRSIDHRSDLFSLGAVLYEMLVGRPPFTGSDTAQLMYNIATVAHTAPSRFNREVPPLLDLIVARALEKDAGTRYQNAGEMMADLKACLAALQVPLAVPDARSQTATLKLPASAMTETDTGTEFLSSIPPSPRSGADTQTQLLTSGGAARPSRTELTTVYPLSRHFSSNEAIKRLADPSPELRAQLAMPKARTGLRRLVADPDGLIAAGIVLASLGVAVAVALLHRG